MKKLRRWAVVESEQWKFFLAVAGFGGVLLLTLDVIISFIPCCWPLFQAAHYLLSAIPQTLAALIGVSFAVLLVGFQMTSSTFSKRAARLAISDPIVLVSLAVFLVTIVHSLSFLAFQKELWALKLPDPVFHAAGVSSLFAACLCTVLLAWVCWRVTRLLKLKGLLHRLEHRLTALQDISFESFEQHKDLVRESRYLSVFTDLANSAITSRDPFIVRECSEVLEHIILSALDGAYGMRECLSHRSPSEENSSAHGFIDNHLRAVYLMISAADLGCAQFAGTQAGPGHENPDLAHRIASWWIEPGVRVLRHLASEAIRRSWGKELALIFGYMRRIHRESAFFSVREASVRWANELRGSVIYGEWKEALTQTARQLPTNITLFLHWCIDVRDMLPARGLLLGRAGVEQFDWPNEPLMKHWQDTGSYSSDRSRAFRETIEHQNLLKSIEALWAGFFDVGGHALYQALQEGKGSQVLADYLEMLCDTIRLEVNAFTKLKESFLEDVLTKALKIPHVNWDRVPGVHREPKSFYYPRFWAILRVVLHVRGLWPADRIAGPAKIRGMKERLEEGLGMLQGSEARPICYNLIRRGVVDNEEQLRNALKALRTAIDERVALQEKVLRKQIAAAPIEKKRNAYKDGISKGFLDMLEEVRDVAELKQNADLSQFGPEDFRVDWGMEVGRHFLVADGIDPHRGYRIASGREEGQKIAEKMRQTFIETIAAKAKQKPVKIKCSLEELPAKLASVVKTLAKTIGADKFLVCPSNDLHMAPFMLAFELRRKERTDETVAELQVWEKLGNEFGPTLRQEILGDLDAVFFPAKDVGTLTILEEPLQNIEVKEHTRDDGEPMVTFRIGEPFKIDVNPEFCFGIKITDLKRRGRD